MKLCGVLLCLLAAIGSSQLEAQAAASAKFVPGLSLGVAYTPDNDFNSIGWCIAGSLEHLVGKTIELRGRLSALGLQADVQGEHPNATYGFLAADVLGSDLFSPTGGVGLYYVDLQSPLADTGSSSLEFGINAGLRFLAPYHDGEHAFTVDGTLHHVFAEGPSLLITVGVGWVF